MLIEGVKTVLVTAFQQAFTDEFWHSFNPSAKQINPEQIVLREYPTDKITFPMVRVGVQFDDLYWDNISQANVNQTPSEQNAKIDGNVILDCYALSPEARDKLVDAFLTLMTWRKLNIPNAFDTSIVNQTIGNPKLPLVKLEMGNIEIGALDDDEDLPWAPNGGRIYMGSLAVGFIATSGFIPEEGENIIKTITTTVNKSQ
jgi:hypothetical protein